LSLVSSLLHFRLVSRARLYDGLRFSGSRQRTIPSTSSLLS
jgi:hypothetical protein